MRFVRYKLGNEEPNFGWLLEDRVGAIEGVPYGEFHRFEAEMPLASVQLLAPVTPSKIVCVGRNYPEHAREHEAEIPEYPLLFLKPSSSVVGPGEKILIPPQSRQVEHEAELAVVIGKKARWVVAENATEYVLGYTIGNDITARDLQRRDSQWSRAKGFDTFCPLGPWIETDLDPADVLITCRVNGEMRQMASSREMVFTIQQIVAFVSSVMTLEPGDVVLTGTPAGVGPLESGDLMATSIEGIGELINPIESEPNHSL